MSGDSEGFIGHIRRSSFSATSTKIIIEVENSFLEVSYEEEMQFPVTMHPHEIKNSLQGLQTPNGENIFIKLENITSLIDVINATNEDISKKN